MGGEGRGGGVWDGGWGKWSSMLTEKDLFKEGVKERKKEKLTRGKRGRRE